MGRRVLRLIGALALLVILGAGVILGIGTRALHSSPELAAESFVAGAPDSAMIAEGERLVTLYQCADCHGSSLAGASFIRGMPFMNLPAPNLTPAGIGGRLTDLEWERAIRHGVGSNGRALVIMPAEAFAGLSDADLSAMIGYLRSLAPIPNDTLVERSIGPAGRVAAAFGPTSLMPAGKVDHTAVHPAATPGAGSADQGRYLAQACAACHGPSFGGMTLPFADDLLAPDLTPGNPDGMARWTEQQFVRAMREGLRPDGRQLSAVMPWPAFARYADAELHALFTYLRSVPAASR